MKSLTLNTEFRTSLANDILSSLNNPKYSDLTIQYSENDIMTSFPCHKALLACRSDYFQSMFVSGMSEKTSQEMLIQEQVSSEIFSLILKYFYSDVIKITPDNVVDCFKLGDRFRIDSVKNQAISEIITGMDIENAAYFYGLASYYNAPHLKETTKTFILLSTNYHSVIKSETWKTLTKEEIEELQELYVKANPKPTQGQPKSSSKSSSFSKKFQNKK
jgi:BTB/POZ domain-containing protein 9